MMRLYRSMAEQMGRQDERINFYKLASIFLRPVPEALRTLLKVVIRQFPDGKWSIIEFLRFIRKDPSNRPSMSPSKDDIRVRKEWQVKWQMFLKKRNFNVSVDQVPHLLSDNCDRWDVTLLHCVLREVNDVHKLSEDAGVFEGVKSLKRLRNDEYGHRSNDTATGDELEQVISQVIADIEKLHPVLFKTVKEFIDGVEVIHKEKLRFGPPHEKIIDEWKEERGRIQAWMEQMRDDVDCMKERVDEHDGKLDLIRKRVHCHDEEMDSAMKRMNQRDEELRQGRERMNRHDEELRQGRERMNRHAEELRQRRINQGKTEVVFKDNVIKDSTINIYR